MSIFFLTSKIFNFFLHPFHWMIIMGILLFFTKKKRTKKWLTGILIAIFLLFTNEAILNLAITNWQPASVELNGKNYSAGILLGGMIVTDKYDHNYMWQPTDRLLKTIELYYQGNIKKIIVTGGSYDKDAQSEAEFLKNELIRCGIPAIDILTEGRSVNTFENAAFSKTILDSAHLLPPYVLITSAMHIPRSTLVFEKAGMHVIPYPTNYEVVNRKLKPDILLMPKLAIMDIWARFLKEITGIWAYKLTGKA